MATIRTDRKGFRWNPLEGNKEHPAGPWTPCVRVPESESETEICIHMYICMETALGRDQEGNEEKKRGQRNDPSRMWFLERSSFSSVLWGAMEENCPATWHPTLGQGRGALVPFSLLVISHRIKGNGWASMVQLQKPLHKVVQEAKVNPYRCKPLAGEPTAAGDSHKPPTATSV